MKQKERRILERKKKEKSGEGRSMGDIGESRNLVARGSATSESIDGTHGREGTQRYKKKTDGRDSPPGARLWPPRLPRRVRPLEPACAGFPFAAVSESEAAPGSASSAWWWRTAPIIPLREAVQLKRELPPAPVPRPARVWRQGRPVPPARALPRPSQRCRHC